MSYFLFLIILCLGGAGYYEYTTLQQQITDLDSSVTQLEEKNKSLEDENGKLTKTVADDDAKVAAMAKMFPGGQAPVIAPPAGPAPGAPAAPATTTAPVLSNILETVTTTDGKTYQNCRLLKVEADGIVINHAEGITKLPYLSLPAELRTRFGYDPAKGTGITADQVIFDEKQRQAAGD